ncbi:MAG: ammonium transporter [Lachnospira sp.]|nr:ammonium transporter [Lachnospira sp.]
MEFSPVNTAWVLIAAALVFFMQAGFAILESGLTRAKNAGNIIMKNLMDFCIGTPIYWFVGFGIMFGTGSLVGGIDLFTRGDYSAVTPDGVPFYAFFIFQTVFCATAATIVSGAMAERTDFRAYCIYSAIISLIVYPVSGHWIWGGGWLADMGFHDFAGSCAVHMVGGCAALVGAIVLGPRIGKYDKNGKPRAIPGHNLTMAALGVFILWFCWFGFNGGSTVAMEGTTVAAGGVGEITMGALAGSVFSTTNLCAAVATIVAMMFTWIKYKKPDVSMSLNGTLAGLVMVTASTDCIDMYGAAIEGIIAGIAVVVGIEFIDKVLKVDDPVGAVGVHGVNGLLGTFCVGLFSTGQNGVGKGLFYGGGFTQLGIQALGIICVLAWVGVMMTITFTILKHTVGLRVEPEIEIAGLDQAEHGLASAYAGFEISTSELTSDSDYDVIGSEKMEDSVPAVVKSLDVPDGKKITKVEILMKQERFEKLKKAMNEIGVTGMTVTQVLGCGTQKGAPEYYRGVPVEMQLLPKIQVEMVISKVPTMDVINAARQALYTGHIGDGKIFVYDVEDVFKVRTGESGYDALQGADD